MRDYKDVKRIFKENFPQSEAGKNYIMFLDYHNNFLKVGELFIYGDPVKWIDRVLSVSRFQYPNLGGFILIYRRDNKTPLSSEQEKLHKDLKNYYSLSEMHVVDSVVIYDRGVYSYEENALLKAARKR